MRRFTLVLLAVVAGVSQLFSHAIAEYAHVAEDVAVIAGDVRSVIEDLANDEGVHVAAGDVVDSWGHLKSAGAALRHGGGLAAALTDLHAAMEKAHDAYVALSGDADLADAAARVRDLVGRIADVIRALHPDAELGAAPPDMSAVTKQAAAVMDGMDRFAACFATGTPYHPDPPATPGTACGDHDWVGQVSNSFGKWVDAALQVIQESGGAT